MRILDKALISIGALSAALVAMTALVFESLPPTIPIHWNSAGQVDGIADKPWIFLLAASPFLVSVLVVIAARFDPQSKNIMDREKTFATMVVAMAGLFAAIYGVTIITSLKLLPKNSPTLIFIILGIALIIMGNFMPRMKRNYSVGIRLPWAMDNDAVWAITHRFGGKAIVALGILISASAFMPARLASIVTIAGFSAALVSIATVSYFASRKQRGNR